LILGLLPTRFVQTLKFPLGVVIGTIFTPPDGTSSRPVLPKYDSTAAGTSEVDVGGAEGEQAPTPSTVIKNAILFMRPPRQVGAVFLCAKFVEL
jgi:hypothetical protein